MKIGLFGIGLNTYWGQFDGLLERLQGYQRQIAEKMSGMGAEVVDAGMVDDPAKADAAARRLKENDVELVFLYISTYALSSTVLPVVQRLGVPVIVLNLQPAAAIDYDYLNAHGRPRSDDRRVAVALPGLLGAGSGLRVQPAGTEIRHRDRIPGRGVRSGSRSERGSKRRGVAAATASEPDGGARPLLLRDARRVHRP